MKYFSKLFFLLLFWILGFSISTSFAQDENFDSMNMSSLTEYVADFSDELDSAQITELRKVAYDYFSWTSTQIVAVLFPHRNWNELIDIWVKFFDENGIWQKWHNNWLLLLISTEEKKLRIIVGYGLEWAITDSDAKYIVESIRPFINQWDFYTAIKRYYELSIKEVDTAWDEFTGVYDSDDYDSPAINWSTRDLMFTILLLIGIFFWFAAPFRNNRKLTHSIRDSFKKIWSWWDKKKEKTWKASLWILASYIIILIVFVNSADLIDTLSPHIQAIIGWFVPSFLVWFLFALLPKEALKWGWGSYSGWSSYSSSSSSSSRSSSSSSSSSSWYSWGWGSTWWGWAGD